MNRDKTSLFLSHQQLYLNSTVLNTIRIAAIQNRSEDVAVAIQPDRLH